MLSLCTWVNGWVKILCNSQCRAILQIGKAVGPGPTVLKADVDCLDFFVSSRLSIPFLSPLA